MNSDNLADVRMDVHKLAGSLGTFGYDRLNDVLKKLDTYLYDAIENRLSSDEIDRTYIKDSMAKLSQMFKEDNKNKSRDFTDFPVLHGKILEKIPLDWDKSILLFSVTIKPFIKDVENQLISFGYKVKIFNDIDKLQAQLVKKENYLILADIDAVVNNPEYIEILQKLKEY